MIIRGEFHMIADRRPRHHVFRTGIRQNLRAAACATNVAFGIGRGAQTLMDAIGRDEAARES